jgi:hypothetical protein
VSGHAIIYGVPGTMGPWPDEPGLPYDITPPSVPNWAPFHTVLPLPPPSQVATPATADPVRAMATWIAAKGALAEARDAEAAAFLALTAALAAAREPPNDQR